MQNSHCNSQNSKISDGGWKEGWVTSSKWNGLTCVWTDFLMRIHIWTEKCKILTITSNIAKSVMVAKMRVGWPPLNGVVQPVSRRVFWVDSESEHKIFIADLQPLLQSDYSELSGRTSCNILWLMSLIHNLDLLDGQMEDLKRESSYLACHPCYGCFDILTLK